jgi:predicted O-linked N-acetylglucosamine transferase (SPINDLY family)
MRERIEKGNNKFVNVTDKTDLEIANLSRSIKIDIAIDLKGYTQDSRTSMFFYGCAPVQVNYLGYPGTLSAECFDYIIADKTLIPESSRSKYTEKIIYMPNSYQVNDSKRKISLGKVSKLSEKIPENSFVFACFNNNYKITPEVFDSWMRIIKSIDGSVLWLLGDNENAITNLKNEAVARGVDANRLLFAKRIPIEDHLARHEFADLFLDTFPYNAHTTASDALWAGLPVITMMGESFASRVAASLLSALEMPELITNMRQDYESLAIELAANPNKLLAIRKKLEIKKKTSAVFDGAMFAKNLENAYEQIYSRYQSGLLPNHIEVNQQVEGVILAQQVSMIKRT